MPANDHKQAPREFRYLRRELREIEAFTLVVFQRLSGQDQLPHPAAVCEYSAYVLMRTLFEHQGWPAAKLAARMTVLRAYLPYMSIPIQALMDELGPDPSAIQALAILVESLLQRIPLSELRTKYPVGAYNKAVGLKRTFQRIVEAAS